MDVDGFAHPYLSSLYEIECPWHVSDDYYLGLVMSAGSVLDVGCGTGLVLDAAARRGHPGRLVGLDPAEGMLAQARCRQGIEWVQGVLEREPQWSAEFDLVIMTGHAFQELRSDADVRDFLAGVRHVLRTGGHLAFETRNPRARAWDRWDGVEELTDPDGAPVVLTRRVEHVHGDERDATVTFSETYTGAHLDEPLTSRSTLRFMPCGWLDHLLVEAGFGVHERYGNWDRCPFTASSAEIITVAAAT